MKMRRILSILSGIMILGTLSSCFDVNKDNDDSNGITDGFIAGKGIVVYKGYEPLKDKPVNIHYYIPADGNMATMPILFVMPGVDRNAGDYLNAWVEIAKNKKIMVFSLEFPLATYSSSQYIEGGMYSGSRLLPETQWTFSIIEPIFDYIVDAIGSKQKGYDMFGHSAGAQFVHRYMTFVPENRVLRGVSANAGWYTTLDFNVDYPYGLKNSPATLSGVTKFLGKQFFLHLGMADTDPKSSNLNHTSGSDAQGLYRYARGLYYWDNVKRLYPNPVSFKWEKIETPKVAHDYVKMSSAASQFLY